MRKIAIQGYKGCFHEEAAQAYFGDEQIATIPCATFDVLADTVVNTESDTMGIMAIENSIAGSLLQNYRILQQNDFYITGEKYLRIVHNLMVLPGTTMENIEEVWSHPMALNQCLKYLQNWNHIKLVEKDDTALCAKLIRENNRNNTAAIASKTAAKLYNLEIIGSSIETSKVNYTRFFIIEKRAKIQEIENFNKVSIYIRIGHTRGSLLRILKEIDDHNINLSKLQSFPVLGALGEYFFHMDLEVEQTSDYYDLKLKLEALAFEIKELGKYMMDHRPILTKEQLS